MARTQFSPWLAATLERKGLSRGEAALLLGVSQFSLMRWERGEHVPPRRRLEVVARWANDGTTWEQVRDLIATRLPGADGDDAGDGLDEKAPEGDELEPVAGEG